MLLSDAFHKNCDFCLQCFNLSEENNNK